MEISYSWLKDILPTVELTPGGISERLASRGAPVEISGATGIEAEGVVVGRVKSVRKHPNADRLSICEVDNGHEILQVICGAPVIHEGGHYPFAGVGIELPNGMKLKKAKIRGEFSNGMLCSEKELGLGPDEGGIMLLAESTFPGQALGEVLEGKEILFDVEITPNRGDWLSHVGLARELTHTGPCDIVLPQIPGSPEFNVETKRGDREVEHQGISIRIESPDVCPRFLGVIVEGVTVRASPDWLAKRLGSIGQQSINNIVDATNYVMYEMGNPMHAFDLDKIKGNEIVIRNAKPEEKILALDGVEHELTNQMLVVCDRENPQSLAGVIGGMDSSVTEDTERIFLECALFDPKVVRKTAKSLGVSTDASYRFERGVDPEGHMSAVERVLEVILAVAGGEISGPIMEVTPHPHAPKLIDLRTARVESVLGITFEKEELEKILLTLGIGIEGSTKEVISANIPSFRSYDITREIDLIEEIARVYGYDQFPDTLNAYLPSSVPDDPFFRLEEDIRKIFVASGIHEAINPAFANATEGVIEILNPISSEESHLRKNLIHGLLKNLEYNLARSTRDIRLFEIGTVFIETEKALNKQGRESTHVASVLTGLATTPHWSEDSQDKVDFWTLKGIVVKLVRICGWKSVSFEFKKHGVGKWVQSGYVEIIAGNQVIGSFGQISPEHFESPKWGGEVWALEVRLPERAPDKQDVQFQAFPQYPSVDRDLACLLDLGVSAKEVTEKIRSVGGDLLSEVSIFDVYEGSEIPEHKRSLGVRMRYQSFERTLTDVEVDRSVDKIIRSLLEDLNVQQRL